MARKARAPRKPDIFDGISESGAAALGQSWRGQLPLVAATLIASADIEDYNGPEEFCELACDIVDCLLEMLESRQ